MTEKLQTAVFGGGCFWCTEAIFQRLKGVVSVMPGYSGGQKPNPTYEEVCSGTTGHVEATKIEFNPAEIKFLDLLNVFFATHDPTTMNRQGNDVGEQYASTIFYVSNEQKREAEQFVKKLEAEKIWDNPIVTQIRKLEKFYGAENYHQDYYNRNLNKPYCQVVINPKIKKLREQFAPLLKPLT